MDVFINCPNCNHKCSPLANECPKCQFSFIRKPVAEKALTNEVLFDPLVHAKYTETRGASASTGVAVGASIFGGIIGLTFGGILGIIGLIICALIPLPGICIGIPLIIFGVVIAISGFSTGAVLTGLEGKCPYCGQLNKVTNPNTAVTSLRCSGCRETIVVKNGKFYQNYLKG